MTGRAYVAADGVRGRALRPWVVKATAFVRTLPARLVVIPACGHISNLEQPELFNEAVREFCRAHPPKT
jgi:pimeloyl-ACP methyl ester carboxylesterase